MFDVDLKLNSFLVLRLEDQKQIKPRLKLIYTIYTFVEIRGDLLGSSFVLNQPNYMCIIRTCNVRQSENFL